MSRAAKNAKAFTRKSVTGKLRYGLAKTEMDQTLEDIRNIEFSAVLDAGTKGNKKRTEFIVRYWSKTEKKIVEKFLKASTSNKETSAIVAKIFLDTMEKYHVPLKNLININCDSCAILRGKKSGAIKKIAAKAPQISECDIGGTVSIVLKTRLRKLARRPARQWITRLTMLNRDLVKSCKGRRVH